MYETDHEVDNTKRYGIYLAGIVVAIIAVVVLWGRVSFLTELEQEVLPHTLIGYLDEVQYTGTVTIADTQWPQWAEAYEKPAEQTLYVAENGQGGRIGIFADLIYYENRYELRTWFSGKLLERKSEYYYRPEGALYLEPVYTLDDAVEITPDMIVPQGYVLEP